MVRFQMYNLTQQTSCEVVGSGETTAASIPLECFYRNAKVGDILMNYEGVYFVVVKRYNSHAHWLNLIGPLDAIVRLHEQYAS